MTPEEPESRQLTVAVARARRRFVANLVLREAALGATVAWCGPTLLLLLGRALFAWPLLVLFTLAGFGVAGWRLWRRIPDLYQVSQIVDLRLGGADQISTAIYFLDSQEPTPVTQRRAACGLAVRSDLEAAVPFTAPRSAYGLASVLLLASTLFALRYFLERPLRLEQPLSRLILRTIDGGDAAGRERGKPDEQAAREAARKRAKTFPLGGRDLLKQSGTRQPAEADAGRGESADSAQIRSTHRKEKEGSSQVNPEGDQLGEALGQSGESDPIQSYEEMLERDAQSGLAKAEGRQGKDAEMGGKQTNGGEKSQDAASSLLAKLREAMSQMLSRLGQKGISAARGQQSAMGGTGEREEQQAGEGAERSGPGQPQAGGQNAAEGDGAESASQNGSAQDSAAAKAGNGAESGTRKASGSGAGNQEGDKELREARQQEALGRLSELFGRRAANVSGEVTVEAQAGKQVLRTPESQRLARHSDAGGEVSRDEIPLALQPYIKEYFNKIRQAEKK